MNWKFWKKSSIYIYVWYMCWGCISAPPTNHIIRSVKLSSGSQTSRSSGLLQTKSESSPAKTNGKNTSQAFERWVHSLNLHTLDGNPANQLMLVVYPIILKVLYIPGAEFLSSTVGPENRPSQKDISSSNHSFSWDVSILGRKFFVSTTQTKNQKGTQWWHLQGKDISNGPTNLVFLPGFPQLLFNFHQL